MTELKGQELHDAIDQLEIEYTELVLTGADAAVIDAVAWAVKTCHPDAVSAAQDQVRTWRSAPDADLQQPTSLVAPPESAITIR